MPKLIIGVNRPAIVWEILHFGIFPAFPHFCENVLHGWIYFKITKIAKNRNNFHYRDILFERALRKWQ